MDHRDQKDHNYPKDTSSNMKKVSKEAHDGDSKTTDKGAHLNQGKGTGYNQMNVAKGFMTHDGRPGHTQKKNID